MRACSGARPCALKQAAPSATGPQPGAASVGQVVRMLRAIARRLLPTTLRSAIKRGARWLRGRWMRRGVRWGSLRRLTPVSKMFGFDRGRPIDRYYIEAFLHAHLGDIRGRVLEIGDNGYTRSLGGDRVVRSDVLHAVQGNPKATLVGDLASGNGIPVNAFDCIILTQTLSVIYDVHGAVSHACAALAQGGVVLATVSGISQISRYDMDRWGDYWRFTDASIRRLFGDVFGERNIQVRTYGNVLAAAAFLYGLSDAELASSELDCHDPDYQLTITVRAVKNGLRK